ncbi:hypothetical protein GCM10022219_20200 [Microbacterium oryzae]
MTFATARSCALAQGALSAGKRRGSVQRAPMDLCEFDRIGEVSTDFKVEEILADLTGDS